MKTIARVLEIKCFLAAFLAFAFCLTLTYGIEGYLPTIEYLVALTTLSFALGFGEISRDDVTKSKLLFLLVFSSVLFGAQLVVFHMSAEYRELISMSVIEKSMNLVTTLVPELKSDQVLGVLSVFYIDLICYWMPLVLIYSFVALGISWNKTKEAKQD